MLGTRHFLIVLLLSTSAVSAKAQVSTAPDTAHFTADSTWTSLSLLQWRFHAGDNPGWADPDFDDGDWRTLTTRTNYDSLVAVGWEGIGWWRIRVLADSATADWLPVVFIGQQVGATEVFLNGKRVQRFGRPSGNRAEERPLAVEDVAPIDLRQGENLLAVRYSYAGAMGLFDLLGWGPNPGPSVVLAENVHWQYDQKPERMILEDITFWLGGALLMMFLSHALLFLLVRSDRSNLYFALFAGLFLPSALANEIATALPGLPVGGFWVSLTTNLLSGAALLMLLAAVYTLFYGRMLKIYWLLIVYAPLGYYVAYTSGNLTFSRILIAVILLEMVRVTIASVWKGKEGGWIIGVGAILVFVIWALGISGVVSSPILGSIMVMTFPVSVSTLLATRAARRARTLEEQQKIISRHAEHLEEQVTERTAELKQSLEDLKNTQDQLIQSEKMASLGSLTAGIAHEIKNPLNFINNFAEVNEELAQELEDALAKGEGIEDIIADLKQNAAVIAQHGKRADGIVKAMMQHARGGTGEREEVDLNALVKEYIALAYLGKRAQNEDFNVTIKEDLDPSVDRVSIVPQDIGRVLINLLGNAFDAVYQKATEDGAGYSPEVTITTHRSNGRVEVRVSDNGPGVPEEIRKKIFEPFFTTKPTGSGTGVGLSLSYDIVAQGHGGSLRLENGENGGACFVVTLPTVSSRTE